MDQFFNLNEISMLTSKAELGNITTEEHSYLQKMIAAYCIINQYEKSINTQLNSFQTIVDRYYSWASKNWVKNVIEPRERTNLFLIKNSLDKINYNAFYKKNNIYCKPLSNFEILITLAEIWKIPLKKDENSIIQFLTFFMENIYGIPKNFIENIFNLIFSNWKPTIPPLGSLPCKKFSIDEIQNYFFGKKIIPKFSIHLVDKIDRLFSVVSTEYQNHIFLSKLDNIDLFEASAIIHEFQHINDSISNIESNILNNSNKRIKSENLFLSEQSALNAEKIFLLGHGTAKKGRYHWLESNLFYPILLLKCELNNFISFEKKVINFADVCHTHGMPALPISSLFEWGAPFQMSIYCASVMAIDQSWTKFLQ